MTSTAAVAGRLDDGADDGVQARGVAAAGEHADSLDREGALVGAEDIRRV